MNSKLHESTRLCALARELADVVNRYQTTLTEDIQLRMYSGHQDGWDAVYIVSEDATTGKKWQVVKVALAKLSATEREQLNLQVELYNQSEAVDCPAL